jgi:hypothetical protein
VRISNPSANRPNEHLTTSPNQQKGRPGINRSGAFYQQVCTKNNSIVTPLRKAGESARILIIHDHGITAVGMCLTVTQWQPLRQLTAENSKPAESAEVPLKTVSKWTQNGAVLTRKQALFKKPIRRSSNGPAATQP